MREVEAFILVASVMFMLREFSLPDRPAGEIVSYIGTGEEELVSKSTGYRDPGKLEKARRVYREHFLDNADDTSSLFPGVIEVLEHYRDRYLSVITNRSLQTAENTLKNFGIRKYFRDVIGGDDDGCRKPDGCVIHRILPDSAKAGDKSMIVGDMDIDIRTGKASGILTCAVTYGIGSIDDLKAVEPDFMIDKLEEIKNIAA
jgi:phosphoglycolate phosphatase